ncbi:MAG: hypothetical protein WA655_06200, partial [Candidatus Korobacteraceae bacterium]
PTPGPPPGPDARAATQAETPPRAKLIRRRGSLKAVNRAFGGVTGAKSVFQVPSFGDWPRFVFTA